jgi:hypothetical protein
MGCNAYYAYINGEASWQSKYAKGNKPEEFFKISKERDGNPVKPAGKMTKAKPPSCPKSASNRTRSGNN